MTIASETPVTERARPYKASARKPEVVRVPEMGFVSIDVTKQEMLHPALATNLLTAIGAAPHLHRPNYVLPHRQAAWRILGERLEELADRAERLSADRRARAGRRAGHRPERDGPRRRVGLEPPLASSPGGSSVLPTSGGSRPSRKPARRCSRRLLPHELPANCRKVAWPWDWPADMLPQSK